MSSKKYTPQCALSSTEDWPRSACGYLLEPTKLAFLPPSVKLNKLFLLYKGQAKEMRSQADLECALSHTVSYNLISSVRVSYACFDHHPLFQFFLVRNHIAKKSKSLIKNNTSVDHYKEADIHIRLPGQFHPTALEMVFVFRTCITEKATCMKVCM